MRESQNHLEGSGWRSARVDPLPLEAFSRLLPLLGDTAEGFLPRFYKYHSRVKWSDAGAFPEPLRCAAGVGSWKDPQEIGTREGVHVFGANIRATLITFLATSNDAAF
jgi:hypothetical protein